MIILRRVIGILAVSCFFLSSAFLSGAEEGKIFRTGYCEIMYPDDKTLGDFFWRISGKRFTFTDDVGLAKTRVDQLVERTQAILDMYPNKLKIKIVLYPNYSSGKIAKYSYNTNTITIYADKVTDGVFAHELGHAVICNYFTPPPPEKMQEILTQYVDRHLWDDY